MTTLNSQRRYYPLGMCLLALITVATTTPILRADDDKPKNATALRRELREAYQAANYKKALESAEQLSKLQPDDEDTVYTIACLHCLLGDKEKAYKYLEKAVEQGYKDADHASHDSDFRNIWGEDRFRGLLKQMRAGKSDSTKSQSDDPHGQSDKKKEQVKKTASHEDDKDKSDDDKMTPQQHGAKVGELTQKVLEASEAKKRDEALKYALEALHHAEAIAKVNARAAAPSLSLTHYNVACMYSLLGKKEEAVDHLNKAVNAGSFGGDMVHQIQGDADFDNIRKEKGYATALEIAKKNRPADEKPQKSKAEFQSSVTLPEHYDKSRKSPLIVALHHYNGNKDLATTRWKKAASEIGAVLLTPQGTVHMEGDHYEWGNDVDAIEDNIMAAIDKTIEENNIDENKIVIVGFSQGGMLAWRLAVRNPETFCGIIPVAGQYQPDSEAGSSDKELKKLRIYAMVGDDDNSNMIQSNREAVQKFEKMGAQAKIVTFEDVGHDFPSNDVEEEIKALRFVLQN